jgi:hypothetical protein
MAFARHKGVAENALTELGFGRLHVFRPGYIYPVEKRKEPNTMYAVLRVIFPALRAIVPNSGIDSTVLADAMVRAGLVGCEKTVLENRDIREFQKS